MKIKQTNLKYYISAIVIGIMIVIGLIYLFRINKSAEASWWDEAWLYRKSIEIQNLGEFALSNFQVKALELDLSEDISSGKIQSDLRDLRFTDLRGNLLSYWIEDDALEKIEVWVRMPNIPISGTGIYMYYGNPMAQPGKSTIGTADFPALSCRSILLNGNSNGSGNYWVDFTNGDFSDKQQVYCDMTNNDGGWMLVEPSMVASVVTKYVSVASSTDSSGGASYTFTHQDIGCDSKDSGATVQVTSSIQWDSVRAKHSLNSGLSYCWSMDGTGNYGEQRTNSNLQSFSVGTDVVQGCVLSCATSPFVIPPLTRCDEEPENFAIYNGTSERSFELISRRVNRTSLSGPAIGLSCNDLNMVSKIENIYIRENDLIFSNVSIGSFSSEEESLGPTAYYKFDEGSDEKIYDSSGHGFTGTINGPVGYSGKGIVRSALSFSGDERAEVIIPSSISNDYTHTISLWFNLQEIAEDGSALLDMDGRGSFIKIRRDSIDISYGDREEMVRRYHQKVDSGRWYNITLVKIPSGEQRDTLKVYLDGKLLTKYDGDVGDMGASSEMYLGRRYRQGNFMSGLLDELKIYSYPRTASQVKADYVAGKSGVSSATGIGSALGVGSGEILTPPILYYNFDEGYGETAYNYVSTTNNGSIKATWTNDGKFGKALVFSGSNNYVDTDFSDNLSAGDFSASAWIKIPNGVSTSYVVAQSHAISPYASDWFFPYSGTSIFWFRSVQLGTYSTINDGLWHHLMLVWDQSEANYSGYVDGKYIGKSSTVSNYGGVGSVKIGARGDLATTFFTGSIDEVKIYNYALSQDQVKVDYNNGMALVMGSTGSTTSASAEYCVPGDTNYCVSPVLEYKFEKKSGTVAYDTSGNGNDATINGATFARGKFGKALSFDGKDDSITKTNSSGLVSSNGTISYWLYLPTKDTSHTVFYAYETGATDYIRSHIDSGNRIDLVIEDDDVAKIYVYYDLDNLGDFTNRWLYFSWVQDGSSVKLYINGQLKTLSGANSGTWWTSHLNSPITTKLGYGWGYFEGSIDDVKVYDYARTPSQIAWDYNKDAPIAHYKFDECSDSIIHDESGNLNNGTITIGADGSQKALGTCTDNDTTHAWYNGRIGKYNSGLSFDGKDDYVNCGNDTSLRVQDNFTVSAWVKFSGISASNRYFIDRWDSASNKRVWAYIVRANQNYISLLISSNGSSVEYAEGTKTVNDNNFHHVSFVRSGQNVKLYVDGALDVERTTAMDLLFDADTELKIGRSLYDGQIDDVKIFNYALTQDQIETLYSGGALNFN